ncbi:MAG: hypothetical protein U5R30_10290 [Deltaproteobacteria bacterium]|nr:hypothetical protein [Deltaproteobacteria bacterium]
MKNGNAAFLHEDQFPALAAENGQSEKPAEDCKGFQPQSVFHPSLAEDFFGSAFGKSLRLGMGLGCSAG